MVACKESHEVIIGHRCTYVTSDYGSNTAIKSPLIVMLIDSSDSDSDSGSERTIKTFPYFVYNSMRCSDKIFAS